MASHYLDPPQITNFDITQVHLAETNRNLAHIHNSSLPRGSYSIFAVDCCLMGSDSKGNSPLLVSLPAFAMAFMDLVIIQRDLYLVQFRTHSIGILRARRMRLRYMVSGRSFLTQLITFQMNLTHSLFSC